VQRGNCEAFLRSFPRKRESRLEKYLDARLRGHERILNVPRTWRSALIAKHFSTHSRASGNPDWKNVWMPAFAGMSGY
jgi:hypothetical protein